jgi:hypothetical protein
MIDNDRMAALYAGLSPTERARLMARITREGRYAEMNRVGDSLPEGQADHYNRRLRILRRLHSPLAPNLVALLLAAERDEAALLGCLRDIHQARLRHIALCGVWQLFGYPVTEGEYAAIVAMERAEPEPLAAFAVYLAESDAEDARVKGWRPEVLTFQAQEADWGEDEWEAQALALLHSAIGRGELPAPEHSPGGLALPRGVLYEWLAPDRIYEPFGPDYHVPMVEALGGSILARWELHPDGEADAVRARRERIGEALCWMVLLDPAEWPSIHPPASAEEREASALQIQERWPWRLEAEEQRARLLHIGAGHAQWRGALGAHLTMLGEIQAEVFGGEDPLPGHCREVLGQAEAAYARVGELWAMAGDALHDSEWPALPEVGEEEAAGSTAAYWAIFRDMAEAG